MRLSFSPRRARAAFTLSALWLAGCATVVNPVTGEREYTAVSPQQEMQEGREAAAEVEQQMGYVEAPALQAYVAQLGAKLAPLSPRQDVKYEFHAVNMEETNAFALPGGYVYVSRGLLALANSEDELASVMGHEIGHVAARHSAQRETRAKVAGIGAAIATIGAALLGGGDFAQGVGQLAQASAQGWIASYSRDQERQADEIGQKLAGEAGYDPAAIGHFLDALGRQMQLVLGGKREASFLDSHPSSEERVRTTLARAASIPRAAGTPIARSRSEFVRRTEGLLVGPDPAQGVFKDELFLHGDLDFALQFPRGWQTQNSPQAVVARPAQGAALLALLPVGPRSQGDARAAARALLDQAAQQGLPAEDGGATAVGSARGQLVRVLVNGNQLVERTYFEHGDGVYALQAMALQSDWSSWSDDFERARRSFRRLSLDDRALLTETRLGLAPARAGERLEDVSKRSANVWSAAETALYNGLRGDETLPAGFLVKVGLAVPYSGKPKPRAAE